MFYFYLCVYVKGPKSVSMPEAGVRGGHQGHHMGTVDQTPPLEEQQVPLANEPSLLPQDSASKCEHLN